MQREESSLKGVQFPASPVDCELEQDMQLIELQRVAFCVVRRAGARDRCQRGLFPSRGPTSLPLEAAESMKNGPLIPSTDDVTRCVHS